jgi:cytoskeletal protein CcmA (bactofilin family)
MNDSYLSVGEGVEIAATIERCSRIYVAGKARLQTTCRSFVLDASGRVEGRIECDTAEVRGYFEGEIRASERLVVHDTGRIEGEIRYGRLEVADGGHLTGRIEALGRPASQPGIASSPELPARQRSGVAG